MIYQTCEIQLKLQLIGKLQTSIQTLKKED